jgi:hypothetical protein
MVPLQEEYAALDWSQIKSVCVHIEAAGQERRLASRGTMHSIASIPLD